MRDGKRGRWVARCAVALGIGVVILGGVPLAHAATSKPAGVQTSNLTPSGSTVGGVAGAAVETADDYSWG